MDHALHQMAAKQLQVFRGLVSPGNIFECVESLSFHFTQGKRYEVSACKATGEHGILADSGQFFSLKDNSLSSFRVVLPDKNVPANDASDHSEDATQYMFPPGTVKIPTGNTISDGGPSSYYDFDDGWKTWNDFADSKASYQWKEHSFHLGNIGKVLCRWGDKKGTSREYDARKIVYSGLRILKMLIGGAKTREYIERLLDDPQFK